MTIKPVVSQKSNEKEGHGHGQEAQPANVRAGHRSILGSKATSEGQSPQRRNDVFDDIIRHRRSPHKNSSNIRSKREHHKRETREKHCPSPQYHQVHSPHASSSCVASKSPKHGHGTHMSASQPQGPPSPDLLGILEDRDTYSGYNSGDEHLVPKETLLTPDEWKHRDEQFIKAMSERGFIIQDIVEDGACLFRAISLQIYGDQEMHEVIRQQTMDYIYQNREYFAHFVTEDINSYVKRKRNKESHGNHIEIQAMSEIYNRPVELYCYQTTPTNIFNSEQINNGHDPLRLSYQRGSHYNAIIDPYNASVGVGLGLAGYKPESQTREAIRLSEQLEIEQTMFEDKLKTTDWEATNEVIEEQIARESYLQWCRDNMQSAKATTTTVTRSTSTTSSSNSGTALSSTITSSSMKLSHAESCTGSNSKDTFAEMSASGNSDSAKLPPTERLRDENNAPGTADCYDSDDTDMSSTSSTADLYKDNMQLSIIKKLKYGKRSPQGGCSSKRRHKRRRCESKDDTNSSCDNSATDPCPHKRKKQLKIASTLENPQHPSKLTDQQLTGSDESPFDYGGLPSTSKQAAQSGQPVSSFYQSLLESSYAEDGLGQLSEGEMIVKAIRLSRIDFFENVKRQRFQQKITSNSLADTQIQNSNNKESKSEGSMSHQARRDPRGNSSCASKMFDHDDDSDVPSP